MIRTMKERLWLKIQSIHPRTIGKVNERDGKREVDLSLDFGPFTFNGMTVLKGRDGSLSINRMAWNARLLDVPLYHKQPESISWPLLEHVLIVAIFSQLRDWLSQYLDGKASPTELAPWQPPGWHGMEVAIPIDFLKVTGFQLWRKEDPTVQADIILGRHIVLWKVNVFNGDTFSLQDERRLWDAEGNPYRYAPFTENSEIGAILKKLWTRTPAFRETLRRTTNEAFPDFDSTFGYAIKGAKMKHHSSEGIVPARLCFFDGKEYLPMESAVGLDRYQ